ncbi:Maf family protein, partial [Salmonella sp. s60732]|uniref:Maf family protein n=1 Tax=Salmonella sp. s60732 TaxID=3160132 RepID=UPI003754E850
HTALALVHARSGRAWQETVDTQVAYRAFDDAEIEAYLAAEPAYDCAGSAKVEGLGIALLERVDSPDPTALVGLPLVALCRMLRAAGLPPLAAPPA